MDRRQFERHIMNQVHEWYEDYYTKKITDFAVRAGMPPKDTLRLILGKGRPGRPTFGGGHHGGCQECKGLLKNNKRCSRPGKFNGYCGYHRDQYNPNAEAERQIDWSRHSTVEAPSGVSIP